MKFYTKHKNLIEKFILDERFLLNEASGSSTSWKAEMTDTANTLKNYQEGINDLYAQLEFLKKQLSEKIELPQAPLSADANKTVKFYKEVINKVELLLTNLEKGIINSDGNKRSILSYIITDPQITDIKKQLNTFITTISTVAEPTDNTANVKDNNNLSDDELDKINTAYTEFANKINTLIDALNVIQESMPDNLNDLQNLAAEVEVLLDNWEAVSKAMEKSGAVSDNNLSMPDNLIANKDALQKIIDNMDIQKILQGSIETEVQNIIDKSTPIIDSYSNYIDELAISTEAGGENNWEDLFTNGILGGNTPDEIWTTYCEDEIGIPADVLAPVKKTLETEIKSLGYNADVNPFIAFLKLVESTDILDQIAEKNSSSYNAIHDAFVDKDINSADLRGNGKLGKQNIIFSTDLYTKGYTQILQYLSTQAKAIRLFEGEQFRFTLTANKYTNLTDFITDLFFAPGNIASSKVDRVKGQFNGQLNDLAEIERQLNLVFGKKTNAAAEQNYENNPEDTELINITDNNIDRIIKDIKTDPKFGLFKNRLLGYLAKIFKTKYNKIDKDYLNLIQDDAIKDGVKTIAQLEKENIKQKLVKNFTKYNFENTTENILKKLIKNLSTPPAK